MTNKSLDICLSCSLKDGMTHQALLQEWSQSIAEQDLISCGGIGELQKVGSKSCCCNLDQLNRSNGTQRHTCQDNSNGLVFKWQGIERVTEWPVWKGTDNSFWFRRGESDRIMNSSKVRIKVQVIVQGYPMVDAMTEAAIGELSKVITRSWFDAKR